MDKQPWSIETLTQKQDLSDNINELLMREEIMWKQRSKVHWLKEGDRNTAFFHGRAAARKEKNTVKRLKNDEGVWCTDEVEVVGIAIKYFQDLFTSTNPPMANELMEAVFPRVTTEMNEILTRPYQAEEVKAAIFQMSPTKSPGPDGMPPLFYQNLWSVVGDDVINCVLNYLNGGLFIESINYTYIVLIPKTKNPSEMTQFRPISLCNVVYKIISKVLANRLKAILPRIISPAQSAFVPGRQITDNILVTYELLHSFRGRRLGNRGWMALKLDMSKAYDRVEWNFLEKVMKRMGFAERWIKLIMDCISTVSYTVILNGKLFGKFSPQRGIRQGDPLSPYLFILMAEALSNLLLEAEQRQTIHGGQVCRRAPQVSHLFFADDSLLFARADEGEAEELSRILELYCEASGQEINYQKSAIFFSPNVNNNKRREIMARVGLSTQALNESYLGLPTRVGRSKNGSFQSIKSRVWKRIQGWKERLLSRAGKEVLIKAVAQSIPTYSMSVFKLPTGLCKELAAMMSRFWWGSNTDSRKIH